MARRVDARYQFGLREVRILPHNDDHTVATPDNVFSSEAAWDFSGASDISSVPLYTQVDSGDLITRLVDLTGVSDQTAVTAQELYQAIVWAASTGYSSYDIRVTTNGDTRVTTDGDVRVISQPLDFFQVVGDRIQVTAPSANYWIQVFGECAELAGFGQFFGLRWITCDTGKSFKADKNDFGGDTFTSKDSSGEFVSMVAGSRLGGYKIRFIDTATDFSLEDLVDQQGRTFLIEAYSPVYRRGENRENPPVGIVQESFYNVSGRSLDPEKSRAFGDKEYLFNATKGAGYAVSKAKEVLTYAEYRSLGLSQY